MMNDHHALFSTLEAAAAGFHTGRALVIVDKHLESRVVYHHEMSHGKIFQECTDGNLHLCVITALESEHFKSDHAELTALNRYLFDTTRIGHERVATYLGVQSLSSEREMADAIKMMPPTYLDYYNFFGTKLDQITSSYVRYLVAWAAGRLAFNSGRAQGIDERRLLESVRSIMGPTERLDVIGAYLDRLAFPDLQKLVLGCAARAFDAAKIEPFDIMRDEEWNLRILSDQRGLQRFDAAMLVELGLALSSLIPLGYRDEVLLAGYFAPIAQRFLLRRAPPDMKSDGTTDSYDLALELASQGDEMRINRSAPLAPNPYNAAGISQWIDENAQQQIFMSAVEVPGSRGVYKLFLSNGHGLGSSYAPGIPCLVTGAELSSILSLVQSTCSQRGVPIPPFFLFSNSGRREDREFAGFTPPQRSEMGILASLH